MVQSHNFLDFWQLFHHQKELPIQINWFTPDNEAFFWQREIGSEIINASTIEIDSLIRPDVWYRTVPYKRFGRTMFSNYQLTMF